MFLRWVLRAFALLVFGLIVFLGLGQYAALKTIDANLEEAPNHVAPIDPMGLKKIAEQAGVVQGPQPVVFVGNNWQGTITVIDSRTFEVIGVLDGIPDKKERLKEIRERFVQRLMFYGIRELVGEGHNQYVDDMYSSLDGQRLIISRPSFADVVAVNISTGRIDWRFPVAGFRSDHMALSPDGRQVAVSASTGNVVHVLDVESGQEVGRFPTGDSPHENVYSKDGSKIFHASIGRVFTPFDKEGGGTFKGHRLFQVVDSSTFEPLIQFDIKDKLNAAGLGKISPAIRPMAHTADENTFFFQLSFLHGFVEYDLRDGRIVRLVGLPRHTTLPRTQYINDSAHHGIAINKADDTLCIAGTMDDYVAVYDLTNDSYQLLTGLGEKPYWVVTDKTGEYCYVSWSGTDQLSVIRYSDATEVRRLDVGDHPQRVREGFVNADWYQRALLAE